MPRRGQLKRREPEPDVRFQNVVVSQFINKIMIGGKKSTAEQLLYDSFEIIEQRLNRNALEVFE